MQRQQPNQFECTGRVGFASGPRQVEEHIAATLVVYTNERNGSGETRSVRHQIEVWRGVAAIAINLLPGAVVRVRGRIDSRPVIRNGARVYETILVGVWIDVLAQGSPSKRQTELSTEAAPDAIKASTEAISQQL